MNATPLVLNVVSINRTIEFVNSVRLDDSSRIGRSLLVVVIVFLREV